MKNLSEFYWLAPYIWDKILVTDTCWVWTGANNGVGYGHIRIARKDYYAHRLVYERLVGPVPEGMDLDHLCRNRACVRPDHLQPVTRRENLLRGETIVAVNARKTHCVHGHLLSGENVLLTSEGHRRCRECNRERQHRRYRERCLIEPGFYRKCNVEARRLARTRKDMTNA